MRAGAAAMGRLRMRIRGKPEAFRIAMINSEYRLTSQAYISGRVWKVTSARVSPSRRRCAGCHDKHPENDLSGADARGSFEPHDDTGADALGGVASRVDAVLCDEHGAIR